MKIAKSLVENTVGKGDIACNEQFLLFNHSVFRRLVLQTCKNQGLFENGLSYGSFILSANDFNLDLTEILSFGKELHLYQTSKFDINPFPNDKL